MSYRDLRNLCEILRSIGYPRLVSVENFRNPNFPLVADISRWLILQYEPKADVVSNCDTESDRIALVRTFAEFMLINVQVRLNTKRLYQADGYAVKELLKVASVLYGAVREAETLENSASSNTPSLPEPEDHVRLDNAQLKEIRSLSSSLVQKGVALYDMLSKEASLRDARHQALSKAFEHADVERTIRAAIDSGLEDLRKMSGVIETVQGNLQALEAKIEKKQTELERSEKRLQTLKKVRPAFMDEYEELEVELSRAFAEYVNRFRSLSHIQHRMEEMERADEERKAEERLTRAEVARRSHAPPGDDLLSYGGGAFVTSSASDESSDELSVGLPNKAAPPPTTGNSSRTDMNLYGYGGGATEGDTGASDVIRPSRQELNGKAPRKIYGKMLGGDESDDESDMILVDGANSDLGSDDEDELMAIQKGQLMSAAQPAKFGRSGAHVSRTDLRQVVNGNGVYNHEDGILSNGRTSGKMGKGYPAGVNDMSSISNTKSGKSRPVTSGRKVPPNISDDEEF